MNGAVFSDDRRFRYTLTRDLVEPLVIGDEISEGDPNAVLFIGLNPSTADETQDDPTVRRMIGYASRWGYSRLVVCNIFGLRSTNPRALYRGDAGEVVGVDNDRHIVANAKAASLIVCAWGAHGKYLLRGPLVAARLRSFGLPLHALGLTKERQPRHPLYLRGDLEPEPWG